MLYKELNIPSIPKEYLIKDEKFLKENFENISPYPEYNDYQLYRANDSTLTGILQPYFNFDLKTNILYQVIKKNIVIHKDVGRSIVYNYITAVGGNDVRTVWYTEDKTKEILSINIPEQIWHSLNVTVYHSVKNIETVRISLTFFEREIEWSE